MASKKSDVKIDPPPARRRGESASGTGVPIVGIGASAGGLEALEGLFRAIPASSGMAFVLVQHLDPSHASMLTAILQRSTAMPVLEVEDGMAVAQNHVYVIPPNRDMVIFRRKLQLSAPEQAYGHRLPIDGFLRSLAEDQAKLAIGIILSGTGRDGTEGLRAIASAGGLTIVQDPATAKYDGMPTSAIHAGWASLVLPVEKMPEALLAGKRMATSRTEPLELPQKSSGLNRVLQSLRSGTGTDFSKYKRSTVSRRIQRRMYLQDIDDIDVYARYVKEHPGEVQLLFKELLINVTSFFRDPEAFATLKAEVLPRLVEGKPADYVFRVWVAGCATGEEAYSIAIVLSEFLESSGQGFRVQIYATDLDQDAIVVARAAVFSPSISQDVSPDRLQHFFVKHEHGYQIRKEIRQLVVFAVQNLIKDPPFTRLDLVCCRNVLIYLEPKVQDLVIGTLHFALKPGGALMLSPCESVGKHTDVLTPLSVKWKIYQANRSGVSQSPGIAGGLIYGMEPSQHEAAGAVTRVKEAEMQQLMNRALIRSFAPASILTDPKGDILYVHGETGKYLQPAPGPSRFNAIEMAREGLQPELGAAIVKAAGSGLATLNRKLTVKVNGGHQTIALSVRPMRGEGTGEDLLLVSFQDLPRTAARSRKGAKGSSGPVAAPEVEELERTLAAARENLQSVIQEQQASNEEFTSSNEELQSTNEELQSTNEELETSKEELQSANEELMTVNAELQSKIEQLTDMQNDMKNLLDNTSIGTIFLDERLAIRRFTPEAAKVFRLVQSDVGRPLADIKSDLEDEDLLVKAQEVLETLVPCECGVRTRGGTWFLTRIRPYRTFDNVIEGVVLTFTDITQRIQSEAVREAAQSLAEAVVDTVRDPLMVLDSALRVVSASRSFFQFFKTAKDDTIGRPVYELDSLQWNFGQLRESLEAVLAQKGSLEGFAVEQEFPGIGLIGLVVSARRIIREGDAPLLLLVSIRTPTPEGK